MTGSLEDAEDCVQETMLRAWRSSARFEGKASLRTWLYRIATNVCLDLLRKRSARKLPEALYPPATPERDPALPDTEVQWLDPLPESWIAAAEDDPESVNIGRETVSLAFAAALQSLPARQRAVLILHDVLDWRAKEVARLLDASPSAVNAMLQRARSTLRTARAPGGAPAPSLATDGRVQDLLSRYVKAWEAADVEELVRLLTHDARFTMPPSPAWTRGAEHAGRFLRAWVFGAGQPRWRLLLVSANGQPAFGLYALGADGQSNPVGVQVLRVERVRGDTLLSDIATFMSPRLVSAFELPAGLPAVPVQAL